MMFYYEVLIASHRYQKPRGLTYSYESQLVAGQVVIVRLQTDLVVGLINKKVSKPTFSTQSIIRIVSIAHLPVALIKLYSWLTTYYPAPSGNILSLLLPRTLLQKSQSKSNHEKINTTSEQVIPPLTPGQQKALTSLSEPIGSAILHGDTGTGKTRVYLELAKKELEAGHSVIILTPEIGLTPQLWASFVAGINYKILRLHSDMTPAQRRDIWLDCLESKQPLVIIGPRSALFVPLSDIGLIIIDEAHDSSYKQEQAPYYQTTRVAAQLAKFHNAQLILGSATPLLEDYYYFKSKNLPIIRMKEPAKGNLRPSISLIALHDRTAFNRSGVLSDRLIDQFKSTLDDGKQAVCFINRRGTARTILCNQCGWQAACPQCELPLTFHADTHRARCHTCGFSQNPPLKCPLCGSSEITYRTPGTKAITNELRLLFPHARIERFDSDNLAAERLEQRYQAIVDGSVDILVGTQILAKGLDIPLLSTVGIVSADTSLNFPDYTAEERTYQLLAQVIGRVSRGHIATSVVIQTYQPESLTVKSAIKRDYETFYQQQIQERQAFRLPPFCFILKLQYGRASSVAAEKATKELALTINRKYQPIDVIGPAPSFHEKSADKYYWQIIIKSKRRSPLLSIIQELPRNWRYDIDPIDLL